MGINPDQNWIDIFPHLNNNLYCTKTKQTNVLLFIQKFSTLFTFSIVHLYHHRYHHFKLLIIIVCCFTQKWTMYNWNKCRNNKLWATNQHLKHLNGSSSKLTSILWCSIHCCHPWALFTASAFLYAVVQQTGQWELLVVSYHLSIKIIIGTHRIWSCYQIDLFHGLNILLSAFKFARSASYWVTFLLKLKLLNEAWRANLNGDNEVQLYYCSFHFDYAIDLFHGINYFIILYNKDLE